jgi:hypothetical protein
VFLSFSLLDIEIAEGSFFVYFRPYEPILPGGVIIVIVLLGIIACVLGGILLFICNRHGCCLRIGKLYFCLRISRFHLFIDNFSRLNKIQKFSLT